MPSSVRRLRSVSLLLTAVALLLFARPATLLSQAGQQSSSSSSSADLGTQAPPQQKPPALVDATGPQISLQTSEALFDVAVALNACGYDSGLDESDPLRQHVRNQVNVAVQASPAAQETRDQLCSFIRQHRLSDSSHDLAQYVSLALYLTPPPQLTTSVELPEMPPDSTQVVEILPLLRKFADQIQLHAIWASDREKYDAQVNELHDPLTRMIVQTNAYLKMPASSGGTNSRFTVVLEPMLAPSETNARVYGSDYLVVTSPVNGKIRMDEVRHTYLHFELEPLLYARASSMDRLLPVLKSVREAPLEYTFRSDIVSLVIECMIRAVEARTMDTGVSAYQGQAMARRSEMETNERERKATEQKAEAVRQAAVKRSMEEGYVLTAYFYDRLAIFEKEPQSIKETIGEMVYGMDVPAEMGKIKNIQFVPQGSGDVVRHSPRALRGLDLAEMKLIKGDVDGAATLAQQALAQHTPEPGRADFILARCAVMRRNVEDARKYFEETIQLSKDPRLLAWSHIYLGRMDDLEHSREEALVQYHAALEARDGQVDTKEAAERGIKAPYGPPPGAQANEKDDGDEAEPAAPPPQKAPQ